MSKLAAISVDLDEIDCYAAIHGLTSGELRMDAIYVRALPRLVGLFDELGVKATFFAIGTSLAKAENAGRLRLLHEAGHEIANHSLSHHYDLTRRSAAVQRREVEGGAEAIERAVGARPVGFRAPGYTMTDGLLRVLDQAGVAYDSSVFPCPSYYALKTSVIGAMRLMGRRSSSLVDDPRVLLAPADPYRIADRYYRRGAGLLELPIGVTAGWSGRLPFIGTNVVSAGELGAALLAKLASARPFVNLELHGIDLADAALDGLLPLTRYQPDLRFGHEQKRASLRSALVKLKTLGYRFVTLREAAAAHAARPQA
ncbi:MAG: polysaccharide deacetylase family protein [Myxococcales bacterium]